MSDGNLNRALWEVAIPEPPEAEERGRAIVEAAFAERTASHSELPGAVTPTNSERRRRRPLPRLALGLSLAALLAILLLSPAGAAVRGWVDDTFTASAPRPEPALTRIPGSGRLLVQTGEGPWVVQPDGSRRLLGDYEEASWSPHGIFVAAAKGRTLSAVAPDGTPHWSLTAAARVGGPRWSPSGERIAYRSGFDLRVVAGDGTEDHLVAGATAAGTSPGARISPAYVAPAWSPDGKNELAYVTAAGRLRIVNSESGALLTTASAMRRITWMDWADRGRKILEASPGALRWRPVWPAGHPTRPALGQSHALPLPTGATVVDAVLASQHSLVAASVTFWKQHGTRSEVIVFGHDSRTSRVLLTVPGSLGQVEWSPDGRRLLVAWPGANQWLFLPLGHGKGRAVANISRAFAPGGQATSFPRIEGWCCPQLR
jgi:WD40-like Beta Propeller Repeat